MWKLVDEICVLIGLLSFAALWIGWRTILPVIGGLWLFGWL